MAYKKECVLTDRECTGCGECNMCDLDPNKVCDNCCKCIDIAADFKSVEIDEIIEDETMLPDADELSTWKYDDDFIVDYKEDAAAVEEDAPKKKTVKVKR